MLAKPCPIGEVFTRLKVIATAEPYVSPMGVVLKRCICKCECGEITEVNLNALKTGSVKSCGCLQRDVARKGKLTHGHTTRMGRTPIYEAWCAMVKRCTNPKAVGFENYGGRGIVVCERWKTFANFLADVPPKPTRSHTLDRIDNEGNYEPGNVRWATRKQQARNMRSNLMITFMGITCPFSEMAERFGVNYMWAYHRFRMGFKLEDIFHSTGKSKL